MRGERGQVTLFVAIGLVLLLIVGLFFMLTRDRAPVPSSEDTNAAVLSTYLGSCLDTIVNEELLSFGAGGGARERSAFPHATIQDAGRSREVIYGVLPDAQALAAPAYPAVGIGLSNSTINVRTSRAFGTYVAGYFGDTALPGVCDPEGVNGVGKPITCKYYPANPPGTPGPSTQREMEEQIARRVQGCAAQRAFEEATGKEVEVGTARVSILFTNDATIVTLTYPVKIIGESTASLSTFQRSYRARYLAMAQFAHDLALKETQDITFDIGQEYDTLSSHRPGFSVTRARNIGLTDQTIGGKADLITITDAESVLDGESLRFLFLVAHRPPMVDSPTDVQYVLAANGDPVTIDGADPDDRPVTVVICPYTNPTSDTRCGGVAQVLVIDEDGDRDWLELIVETEDG